MRTFNKPNLYHGIALGGLAAGLIIGGWSLVDSPAADESPSRGELVEFDTAPGMVPLDEVADLWRSKAELSDGDYVSRTRLAGTLINIARVNGDLGLYDEAEASILEALDANPSYDAARLTLAGVRSADHDFAGALELADRVLEADPGDLSGLVVRGDALLELGDYDGATAIYDRLLAEAPSAPVFSRLARLNALTGKPEQAVDWADQALAASLDLALRPSDRAFYWFQLGSLRYDAGDIEEAAPTLEQALDIDPGNLGAAEKLATVRTAQGRYDEAIELYRHLLTVGRAADLHGALSDLLTLTGRQTEADEELRAGLALVDETLATYPAERRHLTEFLLRHDPAKALSIARIDVAERADVHGYALLGWALYLDGRIDEAADAMEAALRTGITDVTIRYHAGVIAHAAGDDDAARRHLEMALGTNPSFHPIDAPAAAALLDRIG